jgi:hypothetical protein
MLADRRYDAAGERRPIALTLDDSGATAPTSYRQALTNLYFELGLATRLSLALDFIVLDFVAQPLAGRAARSAFGVSDLRLAAKLLLFDDELTVSLLAAVTAPTGSATTAVPLGPGDVRTDLMVLVGKLFERPRLHVVAELGVRLRASATVVDPARPSERIPRQYSHELRYGATLGYTRLFARRALAALTLSARLEGAYAFTRAVEDDLGLLNPVAASYTKIGPELTWAPTRAWQVSVGGHYFVAGRSIPAMGEIALGLAYLR